MPELMRRHVDADMSGDAFGNLLREGGLAFLVACLRDEEVTVHVAAKTRQYVAPIPTKAAGYIIRDLDSYALSLGFRVPRRNVEQ